MIDRFDDVGPGRPATATPRFAAFEGVVGEGGDMAAGITGDDRGRGGGQPGGSGQFRCSDHALRQPHRSTEGRDDPHQPTAANHHDARRLLA